MLLAQLSDSVRDLRMSHIINAGEFGAFLATCPKGCPSARWQAPLWLCNGQYRLFVIRRGHRWSADPPEPIVGVKRAPHGRLIWRSCISAWGHLRIFCRLGLDVVFAGM